MIEAKRQELKKSFKVHYSKYMEGLNSQRETNKTEKLVLFYAIECGVKALLLKKINKNTTKAFGEHIIYKNKLSGSNGHNIKYILQQLDYKSVKLPNIICNNGESARCHEYNQIWRYGIECDNAIEKSIEKEMVQIASWLDKRL